MNFDPAPWPAERLAPREPVPFRDTRAAIYRRGSGAETTGLGITVSAKSVLGVAGDQTGAHGSKSMQKTTMRWELPVDSASTALKRSAKGVP